MREFFHGWRRKAGIVTLVMASALMGIWIRTRVIQDDLAIGQYYLFTTREGIGGQFARFRDGLHFLNRIDWWTRPCSDLPAPVLPLDWRATIDFQPNEDDEVGDPPPTADWHWQWLGFACAKSSMTQSKYTDGGPIWVLGKVFYVVLPHWFFSISLTLLSAYLILIPSRKRSPNASKPDA